MARAIRRVSVWKSGNKYDVDSSAQAVEREGKWDIRLPCAAVKDWPDNVTDWELLMTDHDGDQFSGTVQQDFVQGSHRVLQIPFNNEQ